VLFSYSPGNIKCDSSLDCVIAQIQPGKQPAQCLPGKTPTSKKPHLEHQGCSTAIAPCTEQAEGRAAAGCTRSTNGDSPSMTPTAAPSRRTLTRYSPARVTLRVSPYSRAAVVTLMNGVKERRAASVPASASSGERLLTHEYVQGHAMQATVEPNRSEIPKPQQVLDQVPRHRWHQDGVTFSSREALPCLSLAAHLLGFSGACMCTSFVRAFRQGLVRDRVASSG
jgi:hypothetical protein